MLEIVGLADLLNDVAERRTIDLRQQARQDQFHGPVA